MKAVTELSLVVSQSGSVRVWSCGCWRTGSCISVVGFGGGLLKRGWTFHKFAKEFGEAKTIVTDFKANKS